MSKKFVSVPVTLDDINLSIRGYEILEASARLGMEKPYGDEYSSELHMSIRGRFDGEEWADRFSPFGDLPPLVALVTPLAPFDEEVIYPITSVAESAAPKGIKLAIQEGLWSFNQKIDTEALRVTLTAVDDIEICSSPAPIMRSKRLVTVELSNTVVECGCAVQIENAKAFTTKPSQYQTPQLYVEIRGLFKTCNFAKEVADYREWHDIKKGKSAIIADDLDHKTPTMQIDVLDEQGFILDDRKNIFYGSAKIKNLENTSMRPATWIYNDTFDLEDLSGKPDKIVVSFENGTV